MVVTANNYHINIIFAKLNEIVKDPEIGPFYLTPQRRILMIHMIVKTTVNDI